MTGTSIEELGSTEGEQHVAEESEGQDEGTGSVEASAESEGEGQEEEVELTLEQRYANLLQEHNRLSASVLEQGYRREEPVAEQQQQQVATVELPPVKAPAKFALDKDTLRKALIEDNEDAMGEVLEGMMNFVNEQVTSQREAIRESVLLSIPTVARQVAQQELLLLGAVKAFYEENEDLQPYQSIVGAITNEIVAKDPQLTLQQTLEKVEKEVRTRLGLKKRIQQAGLSGDRGKPFTARPTGTRKPAGPRHEGIREDIAAMQRAGY